ncbi:MAG: NADPH:quinone oxidoreductase family protein [Candidatus Velthaea sp.]
MRSWRVTELGEPANVLRLTDVPEPQPGPGQVLVQVDAAAVNFADLLLCRGRYQEKPALPFTPGLEAAGRVVANGPGARVNVGARVIFMPTLPEGGYQECVVANEAALLPVPDGFPIDDAAALHVAYATAHVALHRRAKIERGETLLVHGAAGGVGSAAVEIGLAAGAHVFATVGGAEKARFCADLGAQRVIDHTRENFIEVVNAETAGRGADVIFDPVGGETFEGSRKCIAFEGRLLTIGFAGGTIPNTPTNHVLVKNYSVVGVHLGLYRRRNPGALQETHAELLRLYAAKKIRPRIFAICPFDELPRALSLVERRNAIGKVVLRVCG